MKTVVLEPLGEVEILDEAHSNWHIADYKKLPDRSYSPEFECGGYKWLSSPPNITNIGGSYSFHGVTTKRNPLPHT